MDKGKVIADGPRDEVLKRLRDSQVQVQAQAQAQAQQRQAATNAASTPAALNSPPVNQAS